MLHNGVHTIILRVSFFQSIAEQVGFDVFFVRHPDNPIGVAAARTMSSLSKKHT